MTTRQPSATGPPTSAAQNTPPASPAIYFSTEGSAESLEKVEVVLKLSSTPPPQLSHSPVYFAEKDGEEDGGFAHNLLPSDSFLLRISGADPSVVQDAAMNALCGPYESDGDEEISRPRDNNEVPSGGRSLEALAQSWFKCFEDVGGVSKRKCEGDGDGDDKGASNAAKRRRNT
ncbi:unnamed protein product [Clonostachys solani]|uniref:Uncharacterized protein n=1 Tax=Clonostachys solani TaxID=160281 RepID=A0A9N9W6Q3_9HYPO|nr:unnamed protein product [Clonostachys solani]